MLLFTLPSSDHQIWKWKGFWKGAENYQNGWKLPFKEKKVKFNQFFFQLSLSKKLMGAFKWLVKTRVFGDSDWRLMEKCTLSTKVYQRMWAHEVGGILLKVLPRIIAVSSYLIRELHYSIRQLWHSNFLMKSGFRSLTLLQKSVNPEWKDFSLNCYVIATA